MGLSAPLHLLGPVRWLWGGVSWLFAKPVRAIVAVLALYVAAHHLVIDPRLRAQRDAERELADGLAAAVELERRAHAQTKAAYRAAQAEAARLEGLRKTRVEAEQKEISDAVVATYETRLADARARAGALREQLRRGTTRPGERAAGAADGQPLPGTGATARGAAEAAGDPRLPAPGGWAIEERLIATEQALQLDALIDWVTRQAAVEVNPPVPPGER